MHKSYTLMTFNIPIHLKSIFDELSSFKGVYKTSILNSLIENYCRQERQKLIQDKEFIIDEWAPYYIKGLVKGEVKIKLELIDAFGNLIDTPFNPSERTVILN